MSNIEAPLPPEGQLVTLSGEKVSGRKFKVKIYPTEDNKEDVQMAINGYAIQLKRGEEHIIDECFLEVLKCAVVNTIGQDPQTLQHFSVQRNIYPFTAELVHEERL